MNPTEIEQARFNMIEQQVRTWDVLDQQVLDTMNGVPREAFVPERFASLAFAGSLYLSFRDVSRLLFIYFAVLNLVALLAWRAIARVVFRLRGPRNYPERRVVVVGAGDLGHRIAATIRAFPSAQPG